MFKDDEHENIVLSLAKKYNDTNNINKLLDLGNELIHERHIFGYYIVIKICKHRQIPYKEILSKVQTIFNIDINEKFVKEVSFIIDFLNEPLVNGNIDGTVNKDMYYHFFDNNKIHRYKLPFHFSWVVPMKVGGMSIPKKEDIDILVKMGISNVITCMEEPLNFECDKIRFFHFAIVDREPPNLSQMKEIIRIINSGPTIVHCLGGVGRTNTVLACYIISSQCKNSRESIDTVNKLRQKVLLSESQKEFIKEFSNTCHKEGASQNGLSNIKIHLPKLLMCVGYPASGKSTFSQHISKHYDIIRINQDEQTRSGCIELFNNNIKNNKTIIIDGCNITKDKRKEWLDMGFKQQTWCIWFDIPFEECKYRIVRRKNHPTVKGNGLTILNTVYNKLEPPSNNEGFDKIFHIEKDEDVHIVLNDLGVNIPLILDDIIDKSEKIIKFPRTKHLINYGSASRDDLLCSSIEQQMFLNEAQKMNIIVEEKVDGANLGISIDKNFNIKVQNRSHYVNSNYHEQFKLLDKWIAKHSSELISILEPETEILYGEWLYMKHSINYNRLPDYFLAFDIYNSKTNKFSSRSKISERLNGTSIKQVPVISYTKINSINDFSSLMKLQSSFYDGLLEGVYIRICDEENVLHRAKIIRNDFICGGKHWNKNAYIINTIFKSK